jgi:hypothetical protein
VDRPSDFLGLEPSGDLGLEESSGISTTLASDGHGRVNAEPVAPNLARSIPPSDHSLNPRDVSPKLMQPSMALRPLKREGSVWRWMDRHSHTCTVS